MNIEYCLGKATVALTHDSVAIRENPASGVKPSGYDLDLLYVECRMCGNPVLWEKGKTSLLITASGMDTNALDEECMLLSDGCPNCRPGTGQFHLQMVRVTALTPHDVLILADSKGSA